MADDPAVDRRAFLTSTQAAKRAGVSRGTIVRWEKLGVITSTRPYAGGHRRFRPEDIDALFKPVAP